jgi:predicted flap endonuclease-1-like 5' DNA nuclease
MAKLIDIEGVGEVYAGKLTAAGVRSTGALLKMGSTAKGRKEIAEKSGITETLILEWVNHVDLFRIKGVGEEYADLLEEAGVDTVPELAQRNAENLFEKLVAVNQQKKLVRRLPVQAQVSDWVAQAKGLPRLIQY